MQAVSSALARMRGGSVLPACRALGNGRSRPATAAPHERRLGAPALAGPSPAQRLHAVYTGRAGERQVQQGPWGELARRAVLNRTMTHAAAAAASRAGAAGKGWPCAPPAHSRRPQAPALLSHGAAPTRSAAGTPEQQPPALFPSLFFSLYRRAYVCRSAGAAAGGLCGCVQGVLRPGLAEMGACAGVEWTAAPGGLLERLGCAMRAPGRRPGPSRRLSAPLPALLAPCRSKRRR